MTELRGYTCDGGCGATTMLESPGLRSIADAGWYLIFTPRGQPTLHTCSAECAVRALAPHQVRLAGG